MKNQIDGERKMKRINGWIAITLILGIFLSSLYARNQGTNPEKIFLWQLDYQTNKSYILGSVHFLKKEMYPLPIKIEEAFEQSDVLVVEADISDANMSRFLRLTMEKGMYTGEETLKQNLSEKTYRLTETVLKKNGIDIVFYQKFKPWFLALTISGIELMKMGYNPNFGIDKYFIDRVSAAPVDGTSPKKKILELEGIAFQIDLFDCFSKEENDDFLFYSLQEIFQYQKEIDHLVEAWRGGDAAEMEQLLKKNLDKFSELTPMYKKFIDDRNISMTEKIIHFLKTDKMYFIMVGAAHLIGNQGILRLLEQKGVSVSQLKAY